MPMFSRLVLILVLAFFYSLKVLSESLRLVSGPVPAFVEVCAHFSVAVPVLVHEYRTPGGCCGELVAICNLHKPCGC